MGHCIGLLSLMIKNRLFWCSIWGTSSSAKFCIGWTRVSVYGNSIAGFQITVGIDQMSQINIWVMKEYGVASSWTKFSHQCPSLGMPCPVGFRRNGEVVLVNERMGLISWNPDSQNVKNLEINGSHKTFFGSYVESLVLLNKATNGVVTY
ncbi:hypothetical protein ACB092_09G201500 [Castanea dentata]